MLATAVAFYLPSSIAGEILRPLTVLSLLLTCGLLGGLALQRHGLGNPVLLADAFAMIGLLLLFTMVSPFPEISPGVVFIYIAIAILYVLNLREVVAPRALRRFYLAINIVSLGLGFATAFNLPWADWLLITYYSAFYRELVSNMVGADKPVLTFATHSMAGFMIYLLFYISLVTYRRRRELLILVIACLHVVLLVRLSSTTGMAYAGIAALQLLALSVAAMRRVAVPLAAVAAVLVLAGMLLFGGAASAAFDRVRGTLVGDKVRGLASRYAADGLLAGNLMYLSRHPLEPVGFAFSERLYYGDSGYVVNLVRGSVPLIALMYGGLFLFLRSNLRTPRVAMWIFLVILAFEVGFTPLQYFRFVGFAPFMIVYLNSLHEGDEGRDRNAIDD
jgi:hypothetical protein